MSPALPLSYGPVTSLRVQDHVTLFRFPGQRPSLVEKSGEAGNEVRDLPNSFRPSPEFQAMKEGVMKSKADRPLDDVSSAPESGTVRDDTSGNQPSDRGLNPGQQRQ